LRSKGMTCMNKKFVPALLYLDYKGTLAALNAFYLEQILLTPSRLTIGYDDTEQDL